MIVGRRSPDGDPLLPSRLVLAAPRKELPSRVRRLFGKGQGVQLVSDESDAAQASLLTVRKPDPLEHPVRSMSVTAFRNYLACPYLFYLKHVLKLEPLDDAVSELSPPAFGNAVHDVLEEFGNSDVHLSTDEDQIRGFLRSSLERYFVRSFGEDTLPAVTVQKNQTRMRLDAFAAWQAEWRSQGWEIRHTEVAANDTFIELPDGRQMQLRGRIDRIDYHAGDNAWAILDYKTGDSFKTPDQAHRRGGQWIDLQLPLYRVICRGLALEGQYHLGYVTLPKDLTRVGVHLAPWTDEQLDEAEMEAQRVATNVLDEVFWPMSLPTPVFRRDYAAICQDNVFEPRRELVSATAGPPGPLAVDGPGAEKSLDEGGAQ